MKILIAAGIYPPDAGGPAAHAKAQFEGLPREGIETKVVALAHYRHWPKGLRHLLYSLALLKQALNTQAVYAHDAVGAGLPALLAARLLGKKCLGRIGGDIAWENSGQDSGLSMSEWYAAGKQRNNMMFLLSRFFLRHADAVVVPTEQLKRLYVEVYGVKKEKIHVILNPVPSSDRAGLETESTIIFASRLAPYKNLDFAIRALEPIFQKHPNLKFIIMGDGPEKMKLKEVVENLKLSKNVIFTGPSSQEEVLMQTARCLFVLAPALTEFNPNYVLQGIAYEKPFLISREHGLPFTVLPELTFNPRDKEELAQKVERLLLPGAYEDAKRFVASLDLKMSWEDNIKVNAALIRSIL